MRQIRSLVVALFFALLFAPSAFALRLEGDPVVIPIVTRAPGAAGTVWRSDLWVYSPFGDEMTVSLTFHPVGGGDPVVRKATLAPYHGLEFVDVVGSLFGLDNASGLLVVDVVEGRVEARARIYNTGHPSGEFGQAVVGLPLSVLGRQAYIGGFSGAEGSRVNAGVANPTGTAFEVGMSVSDGDGNGLGGLSIPLAPGQVVQVNNVLATLGIPPTANLRIQFNSAFSENLIYGYVSVVRNDTGDASFLFGTAPNTGP